MEGVLSLTLHLGKRYRGKETKTLTQDALCPSRDTNTIHVK